MIIKRREIEDLDLPCSDHHIYHLILDSAVVYVGQSKNLKSRIYNHKSNDVKFDTVSYYCVDSDQANNCEAIDIVHNKTKLNKNLPKNDKFMTISSAKSVVSDIVGEFAYNLPVEFIGRLRGKEARYVNASFINELKLMLAGVLIKLGEE